MMRYIPATDHRALHSYQAGFTFGKLYASSMSTISSDKLESDIQSLRPAKKFDATLYREGFKLGFLAQFKAAGNQLPVVNTEKEQTMGKLQKTINSANTFPDFMKPIALADSNTKLCVVDITERPAYGDFGPQWMLHVKMSMEDAGELGENETIGPDGLVTRAISFSKGSKGPNSRDRVLRNLVDECPIHNFMLVAIPSMTRGHSPYIDFQEYNGPCVCGHDEEDISVLDTLEKHPF